MPFDGLTIAALCHELNDHLVGARIDKIQQPEKEEIILSLRAYRSGTERLLLSANARWARMHLSTEKRENPSQAPSFCMLLRKHLEGGKILGIEQIGLERIVHIRIEALDDFREWKEKVLICEFMGKHSNIILFNPENGVIIDAIKKYGSDVSSYREVLPGKEYVFPPSQNKINLASAKPEEFVRAMWSQAEGTPIFRALFNNVMGLSPYSAEQICKITGIEPSLPIDQSGEYELSKLYEQTKTLIQDIQNGQSTPFIQWKTKFPVEITAYPPITYDKNLTLSGYPNMNNACSIYYESRLGLIRLENMKKTVSRRVKDHLDRAYRKKFLQEGDLSEAHENEKFKIWGELLTSYAHQFKKGDREAKLADFYTGEEVILSLDPRYTPIENAQRFFKTYNKSRAAERHLKERMQENEAEIDYLESVLVALEAAESHAQILEINEELVKEGYVKEKATKGKHKAKEQKERSQPRRIISSDGLEILIGRNNRQNDWLTLRIAKREDLWLHTKEIPGTHVIINLPAAMKSIDDVPDRTLQEAAGLAAYFSKAREAMKVPVDYTFRQNVKKPSGAKPGMVIYDNYWTINVNPQDPEILGLLEQEELSS